MSQTNPGVLLVGGAGYIGSHLGLFLLDRGLPCVTLDSLERGHRDAAQGELLIGDLRDPASVRNALAGRRWPLVVHFAAYCYVGESAERPADYYENNVVGTYNLLRIGLEHGLERIIFSSTCSTYGVPQTDRIDETHPQAPINVYGQTKLTVERMLEAFRVQHGIGYGLLRYFNAAGADPRGRCGERHDPETHLVPLAIEAALGRRPELVVHGDDYPTPDGTCIRDYIHVADLADAHWRVAERLQPGESLVYNLGTEHGNSVREVLDQVAEVGGRAVPHRIGPRRPGDPPRLVAAATRAREEVGWVPRHDIRSIIETAWRWHADRAG
ncbi:MAG: UDP-glucose 4-epimerase GalE [Candidatus Eiseniibacteriota bacterium]|jgi:UDP-glucose-4-epimerase GalE